MILKAVLCYQIDESNVFSVESTYIAKIFNNIGDMNQLAFCMKLSCKELLAILQCKVLNDD